MQNRRHFLAGLLSLALPIPSWAARQVGTTTQTEFALKIGDVPIRFGDRAAIAQGINGSVPGPLLRFREGDLVRLRVENALSESSSIHWHGLLLPYQMDGVPGISFPGIPAGKSFTYEYDVRQNGTYWYHSHSGLQEQMGVYGPLIIDPVEPDPVEYDREFVVLLSDWTFEDPHRILANLKMADDYYNQHRPAANNLTAISGGKPLRAALADRAAWAAMRMTMTDIADVTGSTYTYLMNGRDAVGNWTGQFEPGERVRLRIINGSAMSFFNLRVPDAQMTVVQADGQNVLPVTVDELQIGTAETYDVVVQLEDRAYTIMAESMDRSGYVRGTLAPRPGMQAAVPALRAVPVLGMQDMGMAHDEHSMDTHSDMHHHQGMQHGSPMDDPLTFLDTDPIEHKHRLGPGVANLNDAPMSRLDHPGIGLDSVPHRALRYSDLKSLEPLSDRRSPQRTLELHLTGNMHRYMWSFDGLKYSEVKDPIQFDHNERVRMILVNDTMMAHPIHLHGLFVELVGGHGRHNARKHTVVVKPAERLAVDLTANEPGRWAFHCHLLYHMKAGMMRAVHIGDPV